MASNHNKAKSPISSHPAFSAIVALWFAALLGIGSLIVPAALFERLFAVTGLNGILPATQAPLGFTARTIIALAGTAIGIVTGLLLARKVSAAQSAPGVAHLHPAKVPISAMKELGAKSLDQPVEEEPFGGPADRPTVSRRRALWISDDHETDQSGGTTPLAAKVISPIENEPELEQELEPAPVSESLSKALRAHDFEAPPEDSGSNLIHTEEPAAFETPEEISAADEIAEAEIEAEILDSPPETAAAPVSMAAEQLLNQPLKELGIVQLVERFALSLQQHPAPISVREEELPSVAAHALRPINVSDSFDITSDEEDAAEDGEDYSSLLNISTAVTEPRTRVHLPEDNADEVPEPVAIFPSQTSSQSGSALAAQDSPRRFDAPVAIRPAAAATNPAAAEHALRDALEKLQQMSGVG